MRKSTWSSLFIFRKTSKNNFIESFIGSLEFGHQFKGSTRNTCSESVKIHCLFKYALLCIQVGQITITYSKNPLYSVSSKSRTNSVLPQPVAPQIIAECARLGKIFTFILRWFASLWLLSYVLQFCSINI